MMSVDASAARATGRGYAAAVANEPAARRLWVGPHPDRLELWLLTEPTDGDTERRLYAALLPVYDAIPDAPLRLHVIDPEHDERVDLGGRILPAGAEEIPLRRA